MIELAGLRICFIASTLGQGGAEQQLLYILRALKDLGAETEVLTLMKGQYWENKYREIGVPIFYVGHTKIQRMLRISEALRHSKPHIIQSQHAHTNLYATVFAYLSNAKEIGAARSDVIHEIKLLGFFGKPSFRLPRWIAANSHNAVQILINYRIRKRNVFFLPNVVDTTKFRPEKSNHNADIILFAAGHFYEQKRFDRLLRVLARVQKISRYPFKAILAGDGPMRSELCQQARHLGLFPGTVEFVGYISNMAEAYNSSDIMLSTSDWEGTPNVLMEAMSCGLPVVATDVGGVSEIVQDGLSGFLNAPNDEEGFVQALLLLIENERLRQEMGEQARRIIELNHSLDILPNYLSSLYEVVLK